MKPCKVANETLVIGKPKNWDDATMGECGGLSVHVHEDKERGATMMISAWELEPGDLEKLARGAPLHLAVYGTAHPVVSLYVGEIS